jgi:hypothetical protein
MTTYRVELGWIDTLIFMSLLLGIMLSLWDINKALHKLIEEMRMRRVNG